MAFMAAEYRQLSIPLKKGSVSGLYKLKILPLQNYSLGMTSTREAGLAKWIL